MKKKRIRNRKINDDKLSGLIYLSFTLFLIKLENKLN